MSLHVTDGYAALTEKEKQTLRLIVRGHDAKSTARHLGLSVHTINERLRDARRKLSASSSREAARLLLDFEGDTPESFGDKQIGEAKPPGVAQPGDTNRAQRATRLGIGVAVVSILLGTLALVMMPQGASPTAATETAATDATVEKAARDWLALVEQSRWEDSWKATGSAFRKLNTLQVWTDVSKRVRPPLGAVVSRTLISQEELPAPPAGYQVVKFRTSYANKADAIETVSLEREDGAWRVVGITIGEGAQPSKNIAARTIPTAGIKIRAIATTHAAELPNLSSVQLTSGSAMPLKRGPKSGSIVLPPARRGD